MGKEAQIEILRELPRDKGGRVRWSTLRDSPDQVNSILERYVQRLSNEGQSLTQSALIQSGYSLLLTGARFYYPGGFAGLKTNLALEQKKPSGYWTEERLSSEIVSLWQETGEFSRGALRRHGRQDLEGALHKYPGLINRLKESLDVPIVTYKSREYWTPERIKQEAIQVLSKGGRLTKTGLLTTQNYSLWTAIGRDYQGGLPKLLLDIGAEQASKPAGYWTPEKIEDEAGSLQASLGTFTYGELKRIGRGDLSSAITTFYPGGMVSLQAKFGITSHRYPKGFWQDVGNIEQEAQKIIDSGDPLSYRAIREAGMPNLIRAAFKYYPGGFVALKNRFKPQEPSHEADQNNHLVTPIEANKQLNKLLEGEIE